MQKRQQKTSHRKWIRTLRNKKRSERQGGQERIPVPAPKPPGDGGLRAHSIYGCCQKVFSAGSRQRICGHGKLPDGGGE